MSRRFAVGDCVRLPDKRLGRVRGYVDGQVRVRVRLPASETHRFLLYPPARLTRVRCAKGWMSPEGYRRYLRATLSKLRLRQRVSHQPSSVRA